MGVKVQNALLDRGEKGNPYSWSAAVFKCERREWGKKKHRRPFELWSNCLPRRLFPQCIN